MCKLEWQGNGDIMQSWRLIDTGSCDGCYNMAVDEAIASAVRERKAATTLRFYTWHPACISIGYFQKPDETLKGSIVRRITGGRAVFHGSDLSYSVVSRTDNLLFPKNINGTYYTIANALIAGLGYLGINPDPQEKECVRKDSSTKYHRTPLCFNTALRHEITVYGRKLAGSAQRRWPDVFLQHGSILVNRTASENGQNSISLGELGIFSGDISLLIESLAHGFTKTLGIRLIREDLSDYESELAKRLAMENYPGL
ncbi:MAG: lipoate--protein ligase family protein [Nitrospirae bacterium]|nr:lipoate--protein ligase family protein [Nitrospirota bacterium]